MKNLRRNLLDFKSRSRDDLFYKEALIFDEELDRYFRIDKNFSLDDKEFNYSDTPIQALSTSYIDYFQIFEELKGESLLDIGAGFCRGTHLGLELGVKCISIEYEKDRIGKILKNYPELVYHKNLMNKNFIYPQAKAAFIYLPWGELSNYVLRALIEQRPVDYIYVIESHGDFIENMKLYDQYFQKQDCPLLVSTPRHNQSIAKYKIKNNLKNVSKKSYKRDLCSWYLKYFDSLDEITIQTKIANSYYRWSCKLKGSYCCFYNRKPSLFLKERSRYLQFDFDSICQVM